MTDTKTPMKDLIGGLLLCRTRQQVLFAPFGHTKAGFCLLVTIGISFDVSSRALRCSAMRRRVMVILSQANRRIRKMKKRGRESV